MHLSLKPLVPPSQAFWMSYSFLAKWNSLAGPANVLMAPTSSATCRCASFRAPSPNQSNKHTSIAKVSAMSRWMTPMLKWFSSVTATYRSPSLTANLSWIQRYACAKGSNHHLAASRISSHDASQCPVSYASYAHAVSHHMRSCHHTLRISKNIQGHIVKHHP